MMYRPVGNKAGRKIAFMADHYCSPIVNRSIFFGGGVQPKKMLPDGL